MEEPQCSRAILPASLPPGCRFYPSEEQLLCYYLSNKNAGGNFHGCDLIREIDLYDYDPSRLPEIACFSYGYRGRKRHWYCYTARVLKGARGKTRMVKTGYWMRKGGARNVLNGGGNVVLGTRTTFVFYLGSSSKNASRTNWMLYEYALVDHLKASFVICRVFSKACHKNSVSENGICSCAEESFSAIRHIGIQHDGYVPPDMVETQMRGDGSIDRKIPVSPLTPPSELDDNQIAAASASVATFQCCAGPQDSQTENVSGLPGGGAIFVGELASQQDLLSILEEDFIELDDLA
ncbi:NAC domain-containing protein 71-like isoform X2 [Neltuma alba]|uniref:NAC domain-containing protein 71-like isoform X2 n=1 Tax=Neltuma alba TaxID=207710 RepID=UPI0010A50586|nr:NAC domain-containing protein 71-like isoform X2 [Prosopis alba]XP_028772577.1 NAC domain-containing protein 71-like isoform X2 [Prosopis alba]XP_028788825.1 NAC domain-containing protein 71-like isoform X2 [Prosopis alba]